VEKDIAVIANKTWLSLMTIHMFLERLGAADVDIAFVVEILYPFVFFLHMYFKLLRTCK
jgi:hypothetical protein